VRSCDLICVPGGVVATQVAQNKAFVGEIRRLALGAKYITSVCTGSLILGAAGLLKGRRATSNWQARAQLAGYGAHVVEERVVFDGKYVTGAGVTAGLDLALTLAGRIAGDRVAQAIQLGLEYDPRPPYDAGSPERAPAEVVELVRASGR